MIRFVTETDLVLCEVCIEERRAENLHTDTDPNTWVHAVLADGSQANCEDCGK